MALEMAVDSEWQRTPGRCRQQPQKLRAYLRAPFCSSQAHTPCFEEWCVEEWCVSRPPSAYHAPAVINGAVINGAVTASDNC